MLALQVRSQCVGSQTASMSPVGPYSTGQVVTVSYTLSSFTQLNSNWIIAFDIDYGTGWSSISQISAPGNPGGSNGSWIWDTQNTYPSGLSFGPGYRFQNTGWNSDWGTSSTGPFTLSFQLVVGSSCLPQDLSVDLSVIGDCQTGGWVSAGCCPIVPYSIYSGTSLGNGNISLTANPTDISCYGFSDGSINLNVSGGAGSYSYSWSNGATTAAISNLTAGSYSVTVTDAVGCIETINNIIIAEPQSLQPSTVVSNVSCNGFSDGSITINSTANIISYLWSDGQITQTASNLTAGTYSYTITDVNGCSFSDNVIVYEPTSLAVALNITDESCFGSSDGTASIDIQGSSTPPGTISVLPYCPSAPNTSYFAATLSSIIESVILNGDNININNNTAGTPDFYEDYTSMHADVTENQAYSINVTLNGIGNPVASNNSAGGKVFIDFNIDGDFNDVGEEIGIIPYGYNTSANLSFIVPVTNVYGPTRMRVVSQYQSTQDPSLIGYCDFADPSSNFSQPFFGATEDYSIVLNNPTVSATYLWSTGETTDSVSGLSLGSYWVNITDANGCVATENFTISSGSPITVLATYDQTICSGYTPSSLNASSGGVAGTYSWADASNPLVILGTGSNFSPPPLTSTTTYTVTLTDNNGCVAIDDIVITVSPVPSVSLTALPNPACEGDDVLLTATSSIPVNQYKFQVNSGSWSNLTSPGWGNSSTFIYNNISTTTQFRVKVKENNGCNASGWSTITVPINNITTPLISHN